MRFTIPAINNDYYDEDYLRVFGFKSLGKNIRVHRSVVFMKPSVVTIGSDVTIGPFCVFGTSQCVLVDGRTIDPLSYMGQGMVDAPDKADADRIRELEEELAKVKNDGRADAS